MKLKKELIRREIAGDIFLVPVGQSVYDSNGLYAMTELGGFLWDLLPEANGVDDLVQAVLADYEVDEATARADIVEFLEKLKKLDII
jgi:hypothetical protein